jgi:site-specific recombinase XerD
VPTVAILQHYVDEASTPERKRSVKEALAMHAPEFKRQLAGVAFVVRHSLCSTMAAEHADVYAIQQRAGHKNISNTMVYTHVSDEQASESCREALMTAFT